MQKNNTIIEVAIFKVKSEYINQMTEIRQGVRKILPEFKGFISIETLQPVSSNRIFADIAKWESLEDAQIAAKAFEEGDERFVPYMQAIEKLEFMGHFIGEN